MLSFCPMWCYISVSHYTQNKYLTFVDLSGFDLLMESSARQLPLPFFYHFYLPFLYCYAVTSMSIFQEVILPLLLSTRCPRFLTSLKAFRSNKGIIHTWWMNPWLCMDRERFSIDLSESFFSCFNKA